MAPIDSPLGTLWVAWNGRGVSEVEQALDGTEAARAPRRAHRPPDDGRRGAAPDPGCMPSRGASPGERRVRIPLDLRGRTEFEVAVWTKALEIPRGEVRPYGWIAAEIGRPKAVRAVGHGARPQPGAADRALPPRRPHGRHDRPVQPRRAAATSGRSSSAEGLDPTAMEDGRPGRRAAVRLDDDADRLLADLPPRAARPGPLPGLVPVAPRGAARRATGRARSAARSPVEAAA